MYYYLFRGKQRLDLTGDFILSHNTDLIKARAKSAAPRAIKRGRYVVNIPRLGTIAKLKVLWAVIGFIWGPSKELTAESIGIAEAGK